MRRLVLGDIHGGYKALLQVFERSNFNYDEDQLIFIGDVADGWSETKECIDELLKVKNLVYILGNHDIWAWDWMEDGLKPSIWLKQGGAATIRSYDHSIYSSQTKPDVPKLHIEFFKKGLPYYISDDNKLFVHGGIELDKDISAQGLKIFVWDRSLYKKAEELHKIEGPNSKITEYEEVYIGHTTTESFSLDPVQYCEVWNLDQGAGWGGRLSIMDVDTKVFWSSDKVSSLYNERDGKN